MDRRDREKRPWAEVPITARKLVSGRNAHPMAPAHGLPNRDTRRRTARRRIVRRRTVRRGRTRREAALPTMPDRAGSCGGSWMMPAWTGSMTGT